MRQNDPTEMQVSDSFVKKQKKGSICIVVEELSSDGHVRACLSVYVCTCSLNSCWEAVCCLGAPEGRTRRRSERAMQKSAITTTFLSEGPR